MGALQLISLPSNLKTFLKIFNFREIYYTAYGNYLLRDESVIHPNLNPLYFQAYENKIKLF